MARGTDVLNVTHVDVSHSPDKAYVVAGAYVASPETWGRFRTAWRAILRDARVHAFHATDFFGGYKAFKHIDPKSDRHAAFASRFTKAVVAHAGVGTAYGLHVPTFESIIVPALADLRVPSAGLTAEMFCVSNCLAKVAEVLLPKLPRFASNVVIEDGNGVGGIVEFLEMQKLDPKGPLRVFTSFGRAPKAKLELQAADLLAFEAMRQIQREVTPDGRALRRSLQVMISTEQVQIGYADEQILAAEVPRLRRVVRDNPHYWQRDRRTTT